MKLFIIIATVVAFAYAAPTGELQHPSPVNPDVLVAIKPEEKIIIITNPKELSKFKRETKQPFYPTILPQGQYHHITKRDNKPGQEKRDIPVPLVPKYQHPEESPKESEEKDSQEIKNKEGLQKPQTLPQDTQNKEKDSQENKKQEGFQKPQTLPIILEEKSQDTQNKRDIPVPLVPKYEHPEESPKESAEKESQENKNKEGFQKPQTLPLLLKEKSQVTQNKRDIPVPLVAKHEHPEESPKYSEEKETEDYKENVHTQKQQKPQTLPLIIKETADDGQQHKRDIPVPLVPKNPHPEETPKESEDKESKKNKNEVFQKPQTLPLSLKETSQDAQNKRDIPVPLVAHHQHPVEFPKEVNEKELNENKKEINSEKHTIPEDLKKTQALPQAPLKEADQKLGHEVKPKVHPKHHFIPHAHQVSQAEPLHKPLYHHHEHQQQSGFHKFHTKSNTNEQLPPNPNEKIEHEKQIHHVAQALQAHYQKPHEHHSHSEILQKSHSTTSELKETQQKDDAKPLKEVHNEENKKEEIKQPIANHPKPPQVQIEDFLGSIHQKPIHQDLKTPPEHKESNENTHKVKRSTDNIPNIHEVQVEDLSDRIYQKPAHPNIHEVQVEDLSDRIYQKPALPVQEQEKKSKENTHKVKRSTDSVPDIHEVQVEDLSDKIYQKPVQPQIPEVQVEDLSDKIYQKPADVEHKPNIHDDHLSAFESTTSTTAQPILLKRPVPVAELFARSHVN